MLNQPIFPSEPRSPFSGAEKAALLLLVIAGIGGMIFGFRYLGKNLLQPFQLTLTQKTDVSGGTVDAAAIAAMKARDTDGDGLSDYDEQYVYNTSAYLADSDSDGYSDKQELDSGNDPNCPVDKTCKTTTASEEQAVNVGEQIKNGLVAPVAPETGQTDLSALFSAASAGQVSGAQQDQAISNLKPDELRTLLLSNGVSQEQLDKLTDDQLMQVYTEAYKKYLENQAAGTSTNTSTGSGN